MAEKQDQRDVLFRDAQYRKTISIAFFNATNAAIELVKGQTFETPQAKKDKIIEIRNWLLEEHNEYYARVVAQVGVHYDVKTVIARLQNAKTMGELRIVWLSLSQDERENVEIKKLTFELRANFMKTEPKDITPPPVMPNALAKTVKKPKVAKTNTAQPDEK